MRDAVERNLPDVVLLDINLPGEDGLTLARFLRERYDVGIIMVTGAADVADRVAGLEVGADDYVTQTVRSARAARASEERPAAEAGQGSRGAGFLCRGGRGHRPACGWAFARSISSRTSYWLPTVTRFR